MFQFGTSANKSSLRGCQPQNGGGNIFTQYTQHPDIIELGIDDLVDEFGWLVEVVGDGVVDFVECSGFWSIRSGSVFVGDAWKEVVMMPPLPYPCSVGKASLFLWARTRTIPSDMGSVGIIMPLQLNTL